MTASVKAVLPWPPSVNRYWRHWQGRTLVSKEGRDYRTQVMGRALEQHLRRDLTSRLKVQLDLHVPRDRRRARLDIDNACKAVLDSLQHVQVFRDDGQIDDLRILRKPTLDGSPDGCVIAWIWEKKE